ncbi:MAG: EAL domain-containing protein [Blautia sp.]|nr:EAL domain-containing protein [Blautia sp.]
MKRILVLTGILFVGVGSLCMSLAPDSLSLMMVGIMCAILATGYIVGICPMTMFNVGFRNGMTSIDKALDINADSEWVAVNQIEYFFHQRTLDKWFREYREKVARQQEEGMIVSDIETVYNEDSIALRCWHSVMAQLPGTLTAVGLLGTFLGLITGISNVGFSSVDAAISSITVLLEGIRTAFYTSIVGVVLSILFNIVYKFLWNSMLRSLGLFVEDFHKRIQPDAEEQMLQRQQSEMQMILDRLDRIPKNRGFSNSQMRYVVPSAGNEIGIMTQIRKAFQEGEFVFYVQPVCNLVTKQVISGEALIRWKNKDLGLIPPAEFLPAAEQSGFIVKLDQHIWELVCKTIRKWIDDGIRPVPISVNISKTDILSTDVAAFLEELVKKYRIPPHNLQVEISQSAYESYTDAVIETETALRQCGFKITVDGFSGDMISMNALRYSNADLLKTDLRFVDKHITEDGTMNTIVDQARKLRRSLAFSGIETAEQLNDVRMHGCLEGQGYYLFHPMEEAEFEDILRSLLKE